MDTINRTGDAGAEDKEYFSVYIPVRKYQRDFSDCESEQQLVAEILMLRKKMQGAEVSWLGCFPGNDLQSCGMSGAVITETLSSEGLYPFFHSREDVDEENLRKEAKRIFTSLHQEGLLVRGADIVFPCRVCGKLFSQGEVEYKTISGILWRIKFPLARQSAEFIVVATPCPETLFADVGLAVHPGDARFKRWLGENVYIPLTRRMGPVIGAEWIDPDVLGGVARITPAYSIKSRLLAQENGLPLGPTLGYFGRFPLSSFVPPEYRELTAEELRERIVAELRGENLLESSRGYQRRVPHCPSCHVPLESLTRGTWIMRPGARINDFIRWVEEGRVGVTPAKFTRLLFHQWSQSGGWPVSGADEAGGAAPVYSCPSCHHIIVTDTTPICCPSCLYGDIQPEAVFFHPLFIEAVRSFLLARKASRGKWGDIRRFNRLMVTDTSFFLSEAAWWIVLSLIAKCETPFQDVLLFSPVGKMRRKPGDPGSAAQGAKPAATGKKGGEARELDQKSVFRMAVAFQAAPGGRLNISEDAERQARRLILKLENIARYISMVIQPGTPEFPDPHKTSGADRWILHVLNRTIDKVNCWMDDFQLHRAARLLYRFVLEDYSRTYLEFFRCSCSNPASQQTVGYSFYTLLKLLHPFLPDLSNRLSRTVFGDRGELFGNSCFPSIGSEMIFSGEFGNIEILLKVIRAVRKIRSENLIPPGVRVKTLLKTDVGKEKKVLKDNIGIFASLTFSREAEIVENLSSVRPFAGYRGSCPNWEILLPFDDEDSRLRAVERLTGGLRIWEETVSGLESCLVLINKGRPGGTKMIQETLVLKKKLQAALRMRGRLRRTLKDIQ